MPKRWTIQDVDNAKAKVSKSRPLKPTTISANALTRHALRVLDLKGFNVWRQNNAAVFDPVKKVFRKNSSTRGISDIIGYHKSTGQFIACEIKAGKDRLSKEQELFLDRVSRSGGIAMVVKSIVDLEQLLKT